MRNPGRFRMKALARDLRRRGAASFEKGRESSYATVSCKKSPVFIRIGPRLLICPCFLHRIDRAGRLLCLCIEITPMPSARHA